MKTLVFSEASTGAADDLAHATDLARRMVTEFGMSTVLGPVHLAANMQTNFLSQQFALDARVSQETATLVDVETRRILEEAVGEAIIILESHRLALDSLANLLCEHETVNGAQIDAILGQKDTQDEGMTFAGPGPNGQESLKMAVGIQGNGWTKANVEEYSLLRWEDDGGLILTRVYEEEAFASPGWTKT